MDSESLTAWAAVGALIVSLSSAAWQVISWIKQRDRDQEQNRLRLEAEAELQRKSQEWQEHLQAEDRERQRLAKLPQLKVKISYGFIAFPELTDHPVYILAEAINIGEVPVRLNGWHRFEIDRYMIGLPRFPVRGSHGSFNDFTQPLPVHDSYSFYADADLVREWIRSTGKSGVVKLRAAFADSIGNVHLSDPLDLDLDKINRPIM